MTVTANTNEVLWVERYRPQTVNDCILKESTKKQFKEMIKDSIIPNVMLFGPPGSGKTTLAKAICNECGVDWIIINVSNERGIDTLRDKISSFASTVSLSSSNRKCVILDEFDGATPILQSAMRNAVEEYSSNCSFIMTANYPNRIIDALHSRFTGIDFGAEPKELEMMQAQFFMRICEILTLEGVTYDERILIQVIQKYFPDNRKILNKLQQYARGGNTIDTGILMTMEEVSIDALIKSIRDKKFKQVAQWAEDNKNNDTSSMYEKIYKSLKEWVEPASIPDAIMVLQDYQKYDSIVPSKELHLVAMCTELMTTIDMK